ncbi:protein FAM156A/FAM156B-like isoform X2 [Mustela putorius furo]|nr:protein FAM156A/FAM156B-like isoform X2 [Mustela putorius furo]XP_044943800.1 protein FAM156A/FAM156B-like isoform X2 [Mustela putorius furo]
MDPVQKCNSTLTPESSPMISEETSREVTAASPPSFSELLMMGLGDLKTGVGTKHPAPLPEGLLQQRYRDEKTLQERRWERSASPQRKRNLLGHMRRRHLDHVAPYRVERKARISSLGDRDQNRFRCECRYCQSHRPSVSGMPAERKGAPHPSSWDTLVQGLSGLTLSLGTSRPGLLPDGVLQQQEREEKLQWEMQQESKRMFQRLLKAVVERKLRLSSSRDRDRNGFRGGGWRGQILSVESFWGPKSKKHSEKSEKEQEQREDWTLCPCEHGSDPGKVLLFPAWNFWITRGAF